MSTINFFFVKLQVMQCCASHLAVASEAQTHFKNVCRALVSEALDLSKFMEKVQKHETESNCKELEEMGKCTYLVFISAVL